MAQFHYQLEDSAFGERVMDDEFMNSFTMNKRPLIVLLDRGYIQRTLEDETPPKYIHFLSRMLLRPLEDTGTELLVSLCTQARGRSASPRSASLHSGPLGSGTQTLCAWVCLANAACSVAPDAP